MNATEQSSETKAVPRIFLFINSGAGTDWVVSMAMAEDGTVLGGHVSSNDSFAHLDIGHTSNAKHGDYLAHYPGGFEVEWVDNVHAHAGLMAAYAKNQAMAKAVQP
jgi:hypothetical protein